MARENKVPAISHELKCEDKTNQVSRFINNDLFKGQYVRLVVLNYT